MFCSDCWVWHLLFVVRVLNTHGDTLHPGVWLVEPLRGKKKRLSWQGFKITDSWCLFVSSDNWQKLPSNKYFDLNLPYKTVFSRDLVVRCIVVYNYSLMVILLHVQCSYLRDAVYQVFFFKMSVLIGLSCALNTVHVHLFPDCYGYSTVQHQGYQDNVWSGSIWKGPHWSWQVSEIFTERKNATNITMYVHVDVDVEIQCR